MSSKKCVLFDSNRYEDEEYEGNMCFHVNPNLEVKDIPTNGEEYLLKVIQERKNFLVKPMRTNYEFPQFVHKQTDNFVDIGQATAPEFLLPTKEWQNLQVADFSDVRMYISRLLAKKQLWPKNFTIIEFEEDNKKLWKHFLNNNEPTLTCLLGLKHSMLKKGLDYLTHTLKYIKPGETIDHKTGQWIYAFLACTRQPILCVSVDSCLRTLARQCAEIRSHFNTDDETTRIRVTPLNLFICLVSRYFMQYDLADPSPPKPSVTE